MGTSADRRGSGKRWGATRRWGERSTPAPLTCKSQSSELKKRGHQVSRPHGHSSLFHLSSSLIPSQPSLRTLPDSLMTAAKNQPTQNLRLSNLFYHENFFFFSGFCSNFHLHTRGCNNFNVNKKGKKNLK